MFGERLHHAVRRIAARELSIDVVTSENCGIIEYPSHFDHGRGSPVGPVFEAVGYTGTRGRVRRRLRVAGSLQLLDSIHADQDAFFLDHGFVI